MRRIGSTMVIAAALLLGAGSASAQGRAPSRDMAPFTGTATLNLGGVGGGDRPAGSLAIGGSVAVDEITGWGAELDVNFVDGSRDGADARASLQTYMLNAHFMWPTGKIRPFGVLGAGAMNVRNCG